MRDWFEALAPRERRSVLGGGAVLAAIVLSLAAVEPLAQAFAGRERRIESLGQQVAWMRDAVDEVAGLRAGGAGVSTGTGQRPPYLAVDTALRGAGLPQPQRLEPVGEGGARLAFDRVPFDPLVRIVGRLRSESGLVVTRARIRRLDDNGRVAARLTFERPGS